MSITTLNPTSDIAAPQGAIHFEVVFAASDQDMKALTYTNAVVTAPLGILPINSAPLMNQSVVASFPATPAAANLVVGVVGINFYQQINGKLYALNNNSTNPLAIEYVAQAPANKHEAAGHLRLAVFISLPFHLQNRRNHSTQGLSNPIQAAHEARH